MQYYIGFASMKSVPSSSATLQNEVTAMIVQSLKWSIYASLIISLVVASVHYFGHAVERHRNEIESKRNFVEDFCSNDTLVRRSNEYHHCQRARKIASRDAHYEAIMETLLTFHLCASETDPHKSVSDGGTDHNRVGGDQHVEVHCAHAWYVAFGVVLALIALGVCGCFCGRRRLHT